MTAQRAPYRPGVLVSRAVLIGAIGGFVVGGVVGLAIGLLANPRTAWFAVLEGAVPGTVIGVIGGLIVAGIVLLLSAIGDPRRGER